MRIHVMSDIHLEFGALDKPMPSGEILVLAGDITLAAAFDKRCDRYPSSHSTALRERSKEFFDKAVANFGRVFYLHGNHEPYGANISRAPKVLKAALKGATLLNDHAVDLDDSTILVGGTLWTDMAKGKAHDYIGGGIQARMNDFNIVTMGNKDTRFTTYDAVKRFEKTLRLIKASAETNPDKTIVVATHHAPSYRGINPIHGGNALDAGYASDLEGFIKSHKNIRYWIHGHTHIQKSYKIGNCTVVSNARGYHQREHSAFTFNPDRSFVVERRQRALAA